MTHESRILKETASIADFAAFERVLLVGATGPGLPDRHGIDSRREIVRIQRGAPDWLPRIVAKAFGVAGWSGRVFARFRDEDVGCVNCHSLSMLPLGVLLKWATGARLVYDPHELETEANGLSGARRRLSKVLERLLYRAADAVIVVGDEIADWYHREYGGVRPSVVMNCPPRRALSPTTALRDACRIPEDATVFLYQGILGPGRGIELMLDAFLEADDPRRVLVFLGMGPLEPLIASRARGSASIRMHPAVPPQRLAEYTASADVGMCLIEDTCLSYRYSLPNKLFEYLAAGVPPLVSNLPEIARIVNRYGVGWVLPDWSPATLRAVVRSIGPADLVSRRIGTTEAADLYTWEAQVPALRAVYERLGFVA